jgi:ribonuclease P/MRP protein subunit RPP1
MKTCIATVRENNFEKARKIIREQKKSKKQVIFVSSNDDLTRKILEKEPVDILVILQSHRKNRQKQRDSGFNQVLAKIAKKNNVKIGICLDEILASKPKQKADILGRIIQNIKLCSKNRIQMKFCGENTRNIYDLKSLGLVLGMPTWMTKNF